jgi:16S rRNA (uracil1498-N3)-methyltransferase
MLLAVGPEGGWEEPEELDRFHLLGFQQVTLGPRILRSDVAVISLLSLANEICQSDAESH